MTPVSGVFPVDGIIASSGDSALGNSAFTMSHGSLNAPLLRLDTTVDLLPCSCSLFLSDPGKASDPETSFQVPPDYVGDTTERLVAQQPTSTGLELARDQEA